ncbi:manganese efflux pump [Halobacillus sp. A1]|uniref:manganese efflux pump MntP n=1 Tax=Halobacillus sp. A1 TaxID=2880262 RepID=UPI0020A6C4CE|nr:manganese efflux pump [Halobacillus sp. A1]MCP3033214.1 manganese efflux pump [Halobacillus sp. A1]
MENLASIILLSIALGMDAFSVSLGMGMQSVRLKFIGIAGLLVGLLHMVMPGLGMLLGKWLFANVVEWASLAGGLLLLTMGVYTVLASFTEKKSPVHTITGFGMWIFAFSVSIDSFPIGFSLGLNNISAYFAMISFGMMSTLLTWLGFLVGKRVTSYVGAYSEIFGGSILCALGLYTIF